MAKFACLSDTHMQMDRIEIPPCDVVLHAGDFSYRGEMPECLNELKILKNRANAAGASIVIVTPGNHDWVFQYNTEYMKDECRKLGIHLLMHEPMILKMGDRDYKVFGSPYQPEFFDWAFNLPRGPQLAAKWAEIPDDTEILITHSPPHLILDRIPDHCVKLGGPNRTAFVGCEDLATRLPQLNKLRLHVFGHNHFSAGRLDAMGKVFVNASCCDEKYRPHNKPIIIEL